MKQQAGSAQQRYEGARKKKRGSKQQSGSEQISEAATAKVADRLIALAARCEELFHAPNGTSFALVPISGHVETWPVLSRGFRHWLAREFFNESKTAPNKDALAAALNVIEAKAHFDGREREVYIRVGSYADRLYLDLGDKRWRAVEIAADGWRIVDRAPIPFRRPAGMVALPEPARGGKIDELRPFVNIKENDNNSFVLTVSFMLAALRVPGPYPVLCLSGEHGAAKSTFAAVLRKLIDPNSAALRALPREDRDLFIAANNAHLLVFDNISKLPDWISDTLCRLSTGGGFATRQLYSDQDEALFDAMRPIVLNGIEDIVVRPDLADRSLFMALENIADNKGKAELRFWRDFNAAHPKILGALLDGVAYGLRELPNTQLESAPRMADFALWATACEGAFWKAGTFAAAYQQNRDDALGAVIEADMVATAVQNFMQRRPDGWTGTAATLLGALKIEATEDVTKQREWPKNPRALSGRLRRAAATLRRTGIEVTFERDTRTKRRSRDITLKFASVPSDGPNGRGNNGLRSDGSSELPSDVPSDNRPTTSASDGRPATSDGRENQPSDNNPLKDKAADDTDGSDANSPTSRCDYCGRPGGEVEVAFGEDAGSIWLHRECEDRWIRRRMGEEGISKPISWTEKEALKEPAAEPLLSWEIDQLKTRGFTPDDLFEMNPERARAILADPKSTKLSEKYGQGADAPPETLCRVCKKPGARFFSAPIDPLMPSRPRLVLSYPLHLEHCPEFFDGGLDLMSEAPDD